MYRRLLVLVVVVALLGLGAGPIAAKGKPGAGPACILPGGSTGTAQVVLDPGHGGSDTGAVNTTYGLDEDVLNLQVAEGVLGILQNAGYTVALTRYDNTTTLGNSERGEIANACGAEVFVEIHFNSSTDTSVDYTETFWGKKRKDLAFSQTMHANLYPALVDSTSLTDGGVGQFANGGLLTATMPSTLVESVFMSNPTEARLLSDGTGQRQTEIAQAIATGVEAQLGG